MNLNGPPTDSWPPHLVEEYYELLEDCLLNGVNGWGATSTEQWFALRLKREFEWQLAQGNRELSFAQILYGEYLKGLPRLTGQDMADHQAAFIAGNAEHHAWAKKRAREPAP